MLISPITNFNNYNNYQSNCNMVRIHKNSTASIVENSGNISFKGVDECVLAAYNGNLGKVRYEVRSNGVNINAYHSYDSYCDYGSKSSLWAAVWGHRYDIVDWLMSQKDINPNSDYDYYNPLATAAYLRDKSSFMRILRHPKTDPNLSYKYDRCWGYSNSTLGFVIQNNDKEMFDALLKHPKIKPTMKHITLAKKLNNEDFATRILNHPNTVIDLEELKKDPNMAPAINIGRKLVEKAMAQREKQLKKDTEALKTAQKDLKQREENVSKAESNLQAREQAFDEIIKEKTTQIRKEEQQKAENELTKRENALNKREKKLDKDEAALKAKEQAVAKQKAGLDQLALDYEKMLTDDINAEMENRAAALMMLYGVNPPETLPEDMSYDEQVVYVRLSLIPRQEKITDINYNAPDKITEALRDSSGKISREGLRFIEDIIDFGKEKCSVEDMIAAINAVKGNHGLLDMKKVRDFLSIQALGKNSITNTLSVFKQRAI